MGHHYSWFLLPSAKFLLLCSCLACPNLSHWSCQDRCGRFSKCHRAALPDLPIQPFHSWRPKIAAKRSCEREAHLRPQSRYLSAQCLADSPWLACHCCYDPRHHPACEPKVDHILSAFCLQFGRKCPTSGFGCCYWQLIRPWFDCSRRSRCQECLRLRGESPTFVASACFKDLTGDYLPHATITPSTGSSSKDGGQRSALNFGAQRTNLNGIATASNPFQCCCLVLPRLQLAWASQILRELATLCAILLYQRVSNLANFSGATCWLQRAGYLSWRANSDWH